MMAGFYLCCGAAILAAIGVGLIVGLMIIAGRKEKRGEHGASS